MEHKNAGILLQSFLLSNHFSTTHGGHGWDADHRATSSTIILEVDIDPGGQSETSSPLFLMIVLVTGIWDKRIL